MWRVGKMANPLAAPFATAATGSLGTSVPVSQSATASDPKSSPQLTSAYNTPTKLQHYIQLAKHYVCKYKWAIVVVLILAAFWYSRSGKQALCSNFGIACDTRPLPGGVREV